MDLLTVITWIYLALSQIIFDKIYIPPNSFSGIYIIFGNKTKLVVKVGLSYSKKNCFLSLNGSPLKMTRDAFYFI